MSDATIVIEDELRRVQQAMDDLLNTYASAVEYHTLEHYWQDMYELIGRKGGLAFALKHIEGELDVCND